MTNEEVLKNLRDILFYRGGSVRITPSRAEALTAAIQTYADAHNDNDKESGSTETGFAES